MALPAKQILLNELASFIRNPRLALTPEELEPGLNIPQTWIDLLRQQRDTGRANVSELWREMETELPSVLEFLRNNLQGIGVMTEENNRSWLIYFYTIDGEIYFYKGGVPLGKAIPPELIERYKLMPSKLRYFHSSVHNGWTFLPSNALGPLPVEDTFFLSELEWDMEEGDEEKLPFKLENVLAVFANGGGDYLCLDTGEEKNPELSMALIWWHEEPLAPDMYVNFWPAMNEWMKTGFEEADPAT